MILKCIHCGASVDRVRAISKPQCEDCAKKNHSKSQVKSRKIRLMGSQKTKVMDTEKKARAKFLANGDFSSGSKSKWTEREEQMLLEWQGAQTDLAQLLSRSVLAIQVKLAKLRKQKGIIVRRG